MIPHAHRISPCPGCATCQRSARRDLLLAVVILAVFVAVFVLRVLVHA